MSRSALHGPEYVTVMIDLPWNQSSMMSRMSLTLGIKITQTLRTMLDTSTEHLSFHHARTHLNTRLKYSSHRLKVKS